MNIQQLRQSLKLKWISYYYKNRSWLGKMRVWGTYDAQRRPSSGFILAALSALEPQLEEVLPFICELNNDPDQIIVALGLNFNPEEQLHLVESADSVAQSEVNCESVLQTFPNHQSVTPNIVTTAKEEKEIKENNSKPVPSVAVTTAVPFQTLSECKYLTFAATANQEKSFSQSLQSLEVASIQKESNSMALITAASTLVESKSQFIPLVAFSKTEIESKSQSAPSVDVPTRMESKSKPRSLLAIASDGESKSRPRSSTAVASDGESKSKSVSSTAVIPREMESKAVSSGVSFIALANKVESKSRLVTTPHKNLAHQVNPPPARTTRLANWIDDSCQGVGWDRD
ncbi:DUF5331 domain-containing protein [Brasilonema bromeliae]|uniref:DUF5331 domain-containing protein n=1 Tax=Brasilonema bromeliae TaxID=383615 RepID=UPI00145F393D